MIATLLIGLLGAFLQYWFTKWLKSKFGLSRFYGTLLVAYPSQSELAAERATFVSSMTWRVWLGPLRGQKAGILFDQAVAKYAPPGQPGEVQEVSEVYRSSFVRGDFKPLVAHLTEGLTLP